MSNIVIYKEYIQDSIINHLERLMGNDEVYDALYICIPIAQKWLGFFVLPNVLPCLPICHQGCFGKAFKS